MTIAKSKSAPTKSVGKLAASTTVMKLGSSTSKKKTNPSTLQTTTVRFGSVMVTSSPPNQKELKRNVSSGQIGLARAASKLTKPGVSLGSFKGVPLFHADPRTPGRLIRELDGKVATGTFVNGKFKAVKLK